MDFEEFKQLYQSKDVTEYPNKVYSKPVVSIMVQTYQHKKFIEDCLRSILSQKTNFPIEILLGEDNSTDGTREVCMKYADEYPEKIRLFLHHEENKIKVLNNVTGNFNALYNFFSAKGDFIAFCEGDDLWTDPLKLQKQVDLLQHRTDLVLAYHPYCEVGLNEEALTETEILVQPAEHISKDYLRRLIFHPLLSTTCFRKPLKNNIPAEMAEVINVDSFLLSYLGSFGEAGFLNHVSPSLYRRHQRGVWSGKTKTMKLKSKILTFQKLSKFYSQSNDKIMMNFFYEKTKEAKRSLMIHKIKNWNLKCYRKFT